MVQEKEPGLCGVSTVVESVAGWYRRKSQASVGLVRLWNTVAGWYRLKPQACGKLVRLWNPVAGWYRRKSWSLSVLWTTSFCRVLKVCEGLLKVGEE